jgi:putative flippase GtrA
MTLTFILLKVMGISPYLTYFLSYFTTILLSYYLNSRLVFNSGKSARNLVLYYMVYGISLLIGLATLYVYRLLLSWDDLLLNYMVIPVTMAWNFLVSSKILKPSISHNS